MGEKKPLNYRKKIIYRSLVTVLVSLTFFFIGIFLTDTITKFAFIKPKFYALFTLVGVIVILLVMILELFLNHKLKNDIKVFLFEIYDTIRFIYASLVILLFVFLYICTSASVYGSSMENTLHTDDHVLIWHLGYEPKRDDIVVIDVTNHNANVNEIDDSFYIKRVVAAPNDTCQIKINESISGTVESYTLLVNDKEVEFFSSAELYKIRMMFTVYTKTDSNDLIGHCYFDEENIETKIVVPEDLYICFGDNRSVSKDSRSIGMIHKEDIMGKCIFRIYPLNKIGVPKQDNKS